MRKPREQNRNDPRKRKDNFAPEPRQERRRPEDAPEPDDEEDDAGLGQRDLTDQ